MIENDSYWDAMVVGAGVAGGSAAAMLAERGWRVLLVEKSNWPREKVCGGCLSAAAISALRDIGIDRVTRNAEPLDHVVWEFGARRLELRLPRGAAVLRGELDGAIVEEARRRGCEFVAGWAANLVHCSDSEGFREVELRCGLQTLHVRAGVVVACDGIGGTLLAGEPWAKWKISRSAWIGVGATYGDSIGGILPGKVHMLVGSKGYVGVVRIDGSTEHLAAALDPAACRKAGGPVQLIERILMSCGRELTAEVKSSRFHGTGLLTRRREFLGGHRVLAAGDACGYVEPFTGEGMAWAVRGAAELVKMLPAVGGEWPTDLAARWGEKFAEIIGRRQRWARALRPTMHHAMLGRAAMFAGRVAPRLAQKVTTGVCGSKEIFDDNAGRFRVA